MAGIMENLDEMKKWIAWVHIRANSLALDIKSARENKVEDEVILERINECLSQARFLVIRKPRSNASSGTDPWDR